MKVVHRPWVGGLKNLFLIWRKPHIILDPDEGIVGPPGPAGPQGPVGPQGPPGEVSGAELQYITIRRIQDHAVSNDTLTTLNWLTSAVTLGTLDAWDTDNPTYLTIPETCVYYIHATVTWEANGTNRRGLSILIDDQLAAYIRETSAGSATTHGQEVCLTKALTVGQQIKVQVIQTSGVVLDVLATNCSPTLTVVRLKGMKGDAGAAGATGPQGPSGTIALGTEFPADPVNDQLFILKSS